MERLDPRVRYLWFIPGLVPIAIVSAVVAGVGYFEFGLSPLYGIGLFVVLAALVTVFALLRYRVWRYEIQDDALFIERGVLTRVRTVVPFIRLQHVDTQRSPVERLIGLSSVVVYTAGSRGADVTIPGLPSDAAGALQEQLRQLAIESELEDAV